VALVDGSLPDASLSRWVAQLLSEKQTTWTEIRRALGFGN
jgi:hypothetical protein